MLLSEYQFSIVRHVIVNITPIIHWMCLHCVWLRNSRAELS